MKTLEKNSGEKFKVSLFFETESHGHCRNSCAEALVESHGHCHNSGAEASVESYSHGLAEGLLEC